ncbi:patatin-like phospholipase family protein [Shewanella xiamenensis]|uniref:patatin-like phospholipase family protein n=1 Tax=Shewanella xiamenensis TaxID=332186 RepID=UPI001558861A|nr:patatin-like phospholipase family protein [Shewanella xiamenensis]
MHVNQINKVGLALTGGGAKGAYHVGAIRALSELHIKVDAVAGASIGALNGAIVASAVDMASGYRQLQNVWGSLASEQVLQLSSQAPVYFSILGALAAVRGVPLLSGGAMLINRLAEVCGVDWAAGNTHLLDDKPLINKLEQYTSPEALRNGLPMYASVYESSGGLGDLAKLFGAALRLVNTQDSEFIHLQSLSDPEMQQILLASAALPLLFKSRNIRGKSYTDGGQGDWWGVGGNTPVKPLVDAGCSTVIIVHLCDGCMWDRQKYPDLNVIEIRPTSSINRSGEISDLLGFDATRIDSWIDQGYQDSMKTLRRIIEVSEANEGLTFSEQALMDSFKVNQDADKALRDAMNRIKRYSR